MFDTLWFSIWCSFLQQATGPLPKAQPGYSTCTICFEIVDNASLTVRSHFLEFHPTILKKCPQCDKRFFDQKGKESHISYYHKERIQCDQCDRYILVSLPHDIDKTQFLCHIFWLGICRIHNSFSIQDLCYQASIKDTQDWCAHSQSPKAICVQALWSGLWFKVSVDQAHGCAQDQANHQ